MKKPTKRAPAGSARKAAKGVGHITLPPSRAEVRTLDNGLEVIVQEDHSLPLVSVQIWVRAGSIDQ